MNFPEIEKQIQEGKLDEAIEATRAVILELPTNPKVYGLLGICLFKKGRFEEAIEPFRKASILDPGFWEAGAKLAQCYDRLHRYEEAYATAKAWLPVNPNCHILQGLIECLKDQVRGNMIEGWERTTGLAHQVVFAQE